MPRDMVWDVKQYPCQIKLQTPFLALVFLRENLSQNLYEIFPTLLIVTGNK